MPARGPPQGAAVRGRAHRPARYAQQGLPDTPNSPQPVFRLAFENDLFAAPVEPWLWYADARTGTSHDGERAKACLVLMPELID